MHDDLKRTCSSARSALRAGDLHRCVQLAADVLQKSPREAEAHFLLGLAMAEGRRIAAALAAIERALAIAPAAEYRAHQARLLATLRREAEAREAAAEAARDVEPNDALTLDTIGCVFARLGDHESALPLFERAVAVEPDNLGFRFNLAATYGFFGRLDEAEAQYEAMLKLDPTNSKAHFGIANLRKQTAEINHIARLEVALERAENPADKLRIHYAAAKECEDLQDHEAVWRHLSTANREHKQRLGFTLDNDSRNFNAIQECFSTRGYFAGEGSSAEAPVFVTGMPRTGTTLVDRILAAHPELSSAGELQSMPLAVKQLSQSRSPMVLDPETVTGMGDIPPGALGEAYLARAQQNSGAREGRFIDKMPLNFLYVGYIARALPQARVVCLRRNPMDTIWSNYKNLFATTSQYYGYSYDLMDAARFYVMFDRLMRFWLELFPSRVLELEYEALVSDQEGQTRALLAHCGLDWDEACLSFHRQDSAVATPSAQQVRQPLYRHAMERWRHYAHHLEPVVRYLEDQGIPVS